MAESRYSRQERLPQIGSAGQNQLSRSSLAVVGLGALGSVGADLLTRAGVGRILLIDRDVVELSNLQRQTLYQESDAVQSMPKAIAAAARLAAVNTEVELIPHATDLTANNIQALLADVDLFLDGTDNFATRYLLNDYAVFTQRPFVYAGVVGTYGMFGALMPGGPCLRCTWPYPPDAAAAPTCRSAGVLAPAVAVIAGWAAAEALKYLSGNPQDIFQGYRYLDVWQGSHQAIHSLQDSHCPCCMGKEFPWLAGKHGTLSAQIVCGGGSVQVPATTDGSDLLGLAAKLKGTVANLRVHESFLRFELNGLDILHFADGRSLIRGTEDVGRARAALAQTLGS